MSEDNNNVNVRMLVPVNLSGGLIGKGGSIIKQFRQDSGAALDIASAVPYATNRVLTSKGTKEAVVSGLVMVANRLAELATETGSVNVVFIIANSQVGCILGRGGAVIKSIREDSGCGLKMSDQPLPGSTDKTLTLKGNSNQVEIAIDRVCEQLVGFTPRPNARTMEVPYVPRPVGSLPGVQGGMGMPYGGPPSQPPSGRGGYGQQQQQQYPPNPNMYGGAPYGAPPPQQYGGFAPPELKLTWLIPVEEQHVGTIIGKGGCNIQDVRARSGAMVKMPEKGEEGKERHITVTGTRAQNDIAVSMIFKKIASYDPQYKTTRTERRERNDSDRSKGRLEEHSLQQY